MNFSDAERDDVGVVLRADVILRDLGAGNDEQSVLPPGARRLLLDVRQIIVEGFLSDRKLPPAECRDAPKSPQQILSSKNVIGDREDVEPSCSPVEIDDFAEREPPVTPRRVYMEVAEQEGFVAGHRSGAHVLVRGIRRAVKEDLRAEVPEVNSKDPPASHRPVPARRGEHPALRPQAHASRLRKPAAPGSCPRREIQSTYRVHQSPPARRA